MEKNNNERAVILSLSVYESLLNMAEYAVDDGGVPEEEHNKIIKHARKWNPHLRKKQHDEIKEKRRKARELKAFAKQLIREKAVRSFRVAGEIQNVTVIGRPAAGPTRNTMVRVKSSSGCVFSINPYALKPAIWVPTYEPSEEELAAVKYILETDRPYYANVANLQGPTNPPYSSGIVRIKPIGCGEFGTIVADVEFKVGPTVKVIQYSIHPSSVLISPYRRVTTDELVENIGKGRIFIYCGLTADEPCGIVSKHYSGQVEIEIANGIFLVDTAAIVKEV